MVHTSGLSHCLVGLSLCCDKAALSACLCVSPALSQDSPSCSLLAKRAPDSGGVPEASPALGSGGVWLSGHDQSAQHPVSTASQSSTSLQMENHSNNGSAHCLQTHSCCNQLPGCRIRSGYCVLVKELSPSGMEAWISANITV